MNSSAMYSEMILDYYRNPKQKGKVVDANVRARDTNPSCGDVIEITAFVSEDVIKDIKFEGKGCAISIAATSMLAESLVGKSLSVVQNMQKDDVLEMLGIPISGIRLKCALLGLKVVKMGVYTYQGKEVEDSYDSEEKTEQPSPIPVEEITKQIERKLRTVEDPELHMDIVTLGLIRNISVESEKAHITMTLTSPMCPFGPQLVDSAKHATLLVDGVKDVEVTLEFTPPWVPPEDIKMMLGV